MFGAGFLLGSLTVVMGENLRETRLLMPKSFMALATVLRQAVSKRSLDLSTSAIL